MGISWLYILGISSYIFMNSSWPLFQSGTGRESLSKTSMAWDHVEVTAWVPVNNWNPLSDWLWICIVCGNCTDYLKAHGTYLTTERCLSCVWLNRKLDFTVWKWNTAHRSYVAVKGKSTIFVLTDREPVAPLIRSMRKDRLLKNFYRPCSRQLSGVRDYLLESTHDCDVVVLVETFLTEFDKANVRLLTADFLSFSNPSKRDRRNEEQNIGTASGSFSPLQSHVCMKPRTVKDYLLSVVLPCDLRPLGWETFTVMAASKTANSSRPVYESVFVE
jgi:hypothetical protein